MTWEMISTPFNPKLIAAYAVQVAHAIEALQRRRDASPPREDPAVASRRDEAMVEAVGAAQQSASPETTDAQPETKDCPACDYGLMMHSPLDGWLPCALCGYEGEEL